MGERYWREWRVTAGGVLTTLWLKGEIIDDSGDKVLVEHCYQHQSEHCPSWRDALNLALREQDIQTRWRTPVEWRDLRATSAMRRVRR